MENGAERGLRERFDDHHQAAGETRLCGRGCCGDPVECRMPILRGLGLLHFFFPMFRGRGLEGVGVLESRVDRRRPPSSDDGHGHGCSAVGGFAARWPNPRTVGPAQGAGQGRQGGQGRVDGARAT